MGLGTRLCVGVTVHVCVRTCVCVCVDVGERERDMLLWISMKWTLYYHLLEVTKQQTR